MLRFEVHSLVGGLAPGSQLRALCGSQIAADQLSTFSLYTNFTTM
jgi:hypothetical protein